MRCAAAIASLPLLSLTSCSAWFFSGESWVDRSRPVALVETTGGVELGATTEFGVLTLGRTATTGPCRVHYFVGPTPLVETGTLAAASPTFARAEIDLKTQHARCLDRAPTPDDQLLAIWTADGRTTHEVEVALARADGVRGDVLADPGRALPTGATVLCRGDDGSWLFAGLIAGKATVQAGAAPGAAAGSYFVFAGVDRVRELLAIPTHHPVDYAPKYRTDDISVLKAKPPAPPPQPK
jgi:hypothetical protein